MIDQDEFDLEPIVWCAAGYIFGQEVVITVRKMGTGRAYHWYASVKDSIGSLDAHAGLAPSIDEATSQAAQSVMEMMEVDQ